MPIEANIDHLKSILSRLEEADPLSEESSTLLSEAGKIIEEMLNQFQDD